MSGWNRIVDYETAVRLSSTCGDNNRAHLDGLTAGECDSRAAGAWDAIDETAHVVYRSAAAHKRASAKEA